MSRRGHNSPGECRSLGELETLPGKEIDNFCWLAYFCVRFFNH